MATWQIGQKRIIYLLFKYVSCVLNIRVCPGTLGTLRSTAYVNNILRVVELAIA
jgi:hypothetical protein